MLGALNQIRFGLQTSVFHQKWRFSCTLFKAVLGDGEKPLVFWPYILLTLVITLSPIIMEVENYKNERKLKLEGPIFHFHDYGTKGMSCVCFGAGQVGEKMCHEHDACLLVHMLCVKTGPSLFMYSL